MKAHVRGKCQPTPNMRPANEVRPRHIEIGLDLSNAEGNDCPRWHACVCVSIFSPSIGNALIKCLVLSGNQGTGKSCYSVCSWRFVQLHVKPLIRGVVQVLVIGKLYDAPSRTSCSAAEHAIHGRIKAKFGGSTQRGLTVGIVVIVDLPRGPY